MGKQTAHKFYMEHSILLIVPLVFFVAVLYSIVGHGGASGYIAVLTLFSIPAVVVASTALVLNLVVAGISMLYFWRGGHFRFHLLWPFLVTSMPAAYLGGAIMIDAKTYEFILSLVLLFAAYRLLIGKNKIKNINDFPEKIWMKLGLGAVLGFISGLIGVGGGIFLSPLLLFLGWADAKATASVSAVFIFFNSITGILGRVNHHNFSLGIDGIGWIFLAAIIGSLLGSRLGAYKFTSPILYRVLGTVLFLAGVKLLLGFFI